MTGQPVLIAEGLSLTHRSGGEDSVGLDDVSLRIDAGELVALTGRSGSGKTTLLSVLTGWLPLESGTLTLCGDPLGRTTGWDQVALIPQALGLLDDLTIGGNIRLPARLASSAVARDSEERARLLEAQLEIEALRGREVAEASLGEQQRVCIARALLRLPLLLLADEPTAHQDAARAGLVVSMLRTAADAGCAVLVGSHDATVVERCDRVVTMADGRLNRQGENRTLDSARD